MTICAAPIKGTMLRIVKEDFCGVPVTGSESLVVVTKGFVRVQMSPQYEDGEEFFERTADGTPCVNEKDAPTLKRMQLTVDFCEVDPSAAAFVADARLLTENDAVTGTGFAVHEGTPETKFSLEVWQRVAGSGACDPSGNQYFIYNAWPHVGNVQIGEYVVENGRSTLQFIAETFAASELWGDGPGTGASYLPAGEVVEPDEHWLWNITTETPPTAACGPSLLV
jgi:hypothetical protein